MKEKQAITVTILLSYLVLAIKVKEVKCVKQGKNTSGVLTNRQVNNIVLIEDGDVYDCIDVNLQPAFNHPLLKDHKIQMEPSSFPLRLDTESPLIQDVQQAQLPIVECPTGTVPILRKDRRGHMAAQNIDEVNTKDLQQEDAGIKYHDEIYGIRAKINVFEPKVKADSKDLSASWIQINNRGEGVPGIADGLGAGSWVSPSYSGDSFARFHVSWDDGLTNKTCTDHDCSAFVQVSPSVGLGGRIRPVSVYDGPQYGIEVLIFKDPKTKNWWLCYGRQDIPIGYWPSSLFTYIKDKGDYALWGGYVQGPTASSDSPQMGSGHFASEGFGKAAFVGYIRVVDEHNMLITPNVDKGNPFTSDADKYTVDGYGVNMYGMYIYYGGPGDMV